MDDTSRLYKRYQFVRNGMLPDPTGMMASANHLSAHMRAHQYRRHFSEDVVSHLWEEQYTDYGSPTEHVPVPSQSDLARVMAKYARPTITMPTDEIPSGA